jgi:hypothetical protein
MEMPEMAPAGILVTTHIQPIQNEYNQKKPKLTKRQNQVGVPIPLFTLLLLLPLKPFKPLKPTFLNASACEFITS